MKLENISHKALTILILTLILASSLSSPGETLAKVDKKPESSKAYKTTSWKTEKYSCLELSFINFDAKGVPNGSAHALGLNLKGGIRLSEIVSLEAGINWLPLVPELIIPLPLSWMPNDDGVYLNLGGGLRFNLVRYHSNRTVPWISVWRVGHAVLSDFSVGGGGTSYSIGVEGRTDNGRKWQVSITQHRFTGNLEIHEDYYSFEYNETDIRAVELNIAVSMK